MKYKPSTDGEWIRPVKKDYRVACCDCGLVHNIDLRIVKGRIQFRATRNERSTRQKRRYKKYIK
jgi:hypothetical protein